MNSSLPIAVNASIIFYCFVMCSVQVHPSMFISQKSQIRNMEHTLVQSKSEWCKDSHPNLFVFLGHLHRATADYMTDKRRAERGLPIRRPRKKTSAEQRCSSAAFLRQVRQRGVHTDAVPACCQSLRHARGAAANTGAR